VGRRGTTLSAVAKSPEGVSITRAARRRARYSRLRSRWFQSSFGTLLVVLPRHSLLLGAHPRGTRTRAIAPAPAAATANHEARTAPRALSLDADLDHRRPTPKSWMPSEPRRYCAHQRCAFRPNALAAPEGSEPLTPGLLLYGSSDRDPSRAVTSSFQPDPGPRYAGDSGSRSGRWRHLERRLRDATGLRPHGHRSAGGRVRGSVHRRTGSGHSGAHGAGICGVLEPPAPPGALSPAPVAGGEAEAAP
jgi:hypothetical protein